MLRLKGLYFFYKMGIAKKFKRYIHYRDFFDENKNIFIHIPKCGGVSLVQSIYGVSRSQHSTWREFWTEDPIKFRDYYKFSFVRDPMSRCFSAYNYLKSDGRGPMDLYWHDKYVKKFNSFEKFVLYGLERAVKDNAEHFIPQHKFICDDEGHILVNFVGHIETMDSDYKILSDKIGVVNDIKVENSSGSQMNFELCLEAKNKIKELYRKDYEIFHY